MSSIVETEGVMGGQPRIKNHRISVVQIAEWVLDEGMAPETVSAEFDLALADIHRALAYYYDNIEAMDEWRQKRRERVQRSREQQPVPEDFTKPA
jgi:uncharacterized protein (DUF433 family)